MCFCPWLGPSCVVGPRTKARTGAPGPGPPPRAPRAAEDLDPQRCPRHTAGPVPDTLQLCAEPRGRGALDGHHPDLSALGLSLFVRPPRGGVAREEAGLARLQAPPTRLSRGSRGPSSRTGA